MIIRNPAEIRAAVTPGKRLLGLDLGTRTIGLALSDVRLMIASPFGLIERKSVKRDVAALEEVIERQDVGGLVAGWPLEMDGGEGARAEATMRFLEAVLARRPLPVLLWDERLSTAAVERMLVGQVDMTRKRRRKVVDKTAAAYILQGALDAMALAGGGPTGP